MNGLVIVHTELEYVNPRIVKGAAKTISLFDNISLEIEKQLRAGNRVYYLPGESIDDTYPSIKAHLPRMITITQEDGVDSQFLLTKRRLIADKANQIELAGVAYDCCVIDLYKLLLGDHLTCRGIYESRALGLKWDQHEFERVFNERLNVHIREELTDKAYQN